MGKAFLTLCFLFLFMVPGLSQDNDFGTIFVPVDPYVSEPPCLNPPGDGVYGYRVTVDTAGKSGGDYLRFTGTDSTGQAFDIWSQAGIGEGTSPEDKAEDVGESINHVSDLNNDPITATSNDGKVTIKPNAGCTLTSCSWESETGQETDNIEELDPPQGGDHPVSVSGGIRIGGGDTGQTNGREQSVISAGFGGISISVECNGDYSPLGEAGFLAKKMAKILKVDVYIGVDPEGGVWLLYNTKNSKRLNVGCTDSGLSRTIVIGQPEAYSVGQTVNIGTYMVCIIASKSVDIDEAMPHYLKL